MWVPIPEPLLKKSANVSKMPLEDGKKDVKTEGREIAAELKGDVRINKLHRKKAFIPVKDSNPNFANNLQYNLLNQSKKYYWKN